MGLFDFLKGSSPTMQPASVQSDRIDLNLPEYRQGCGRVGDGLQHLQRARDSVRAGNAELARVSYLKAVESWKQANETEGGKWAREVELANKEYAAFVESDPTYRNGLDLLLPVIQGNPGILQTDLYNACPSLERETMSYILYFAALKGVIERTKKGRTYELKVT